jgi:hypothetical protein
MEAAMTADILTDRTLETALGRSTQFILGVNGNAVIRTLLGARGLTDTEIVKGRTLVDEVLSVRIPGGHQGVTPESVAAQAAAGTLDVLDEPLLRETDAILSNGHEGARDYLLRDLQPAEGVDSVLVAQTYVRRYRALQEGTDPDRASTRDADRAAIDRLSARGYDDATITEIERLVETAFAPTPVLASTMEVEAATAARREKLVALKKWYDEWATTARIYLTKKSHLIALGLANRKSPKAKAPAIPEA